VTGIDFSLVAVRLATLCAPAFVGTAVSNSEGSPFDRTGLTDAADGAVSIDALPFARDRPAALREVRVRQIPRPSTVDTPSGPGDCPSVQPKGPRPKDWCSSMEGAHGGLPHRGVSVDPGCG
jgi:hypothetical protein